MGTIIILLILLLEWFPSLEMLMVSLVERFSEAIVNYKFQISFASSIISARH